MRIIAALHERGRAAYLSHLDMQRTLQRALRRADMPLVYSQGFNPHPLVAFAGALSTGYESEREWFDVRLEGEIIPADFEARLNEVLPEGMAVSHAMEAPEDLGTLTGHLAAARYTLWVRPERAFSAAEVGSALDKLLQSEELMVQKRTKSGAMVPQNIRPQLYEARLTACDGASFALDVLGELTAGGGLRTEAFVNVLLDFLGSAGSFQCRREEMYFDGLPGLPSLGKGKHE
jgi:radical SAM-linked protein